MAILIFEGVDKAGKTTLFKEVLRQTNEHVCIDRLFASQYIYGTYHSARKHDSKQQVPYRTLKAYESLMATLPAGYIYVEADILDLRERFHQHNEKDIPVDRIESIMKQFRSYFREEHTSLPILEINTSIYTVKGCVMKILEFAQRLDKQSADIVSQEASEIFDGTTSKELFEE